MKIIIPIEIEIGTRHDYSTQWEGKCTNLNISTIRKDIAGDVFYKDTPEEAIIALANCIKNTLTSEWFAMKIYKEYIEKSQP
jgi:hypothetical protein